MPLTTTEYKINKSLRTYANLTLELTCTVKQYNTFKCVVQIIMRTTNANES